MVLGSQGLCMLIVNSAKCWKHLVQRRPGPVTWCRVQWLGILLAEMLQMFGATSDQGGSVLIGITSQLTSRPVGLQTNMYLSLIPACPSLDSITGLLAHLEMGCQPYSVSILLRWHD